MYKKIGILMLIIYTGLLTTNAQEVQFTYPIFGDLPNGTPEDSVDPGDYLNLDDNTASEFCLLVGFSLVSYIDGIVDNKHIAIYDPIIGYWDDTGRGDDIIKQVICDDGIIVGGDATNYNNHITGGQDLNISGSILTDGNSFMTQNELYNVYELEFTILLFISIIVVLNKIALHRTKTDFSFH